MYTDLHCHLLFGLDDGPKDAAGSLSIAKLLISLGFSVVTTTPHALPQFASREDALRRRDEVAELLSKSGLKLSLVEGAENRLDESFIEAELAGAGRHLGKSSYSLVEAPYESVVPALPELLFRLRRKGVRPLLAHPERCAEFQTLERAQEAVRLGACLQLDLGSLVGTYGRQAKKTALKLLEAGLYSVASSDLHDAMDSAKWLGEGLKELQKRVGPQGISRLLEENPQRVLRDEELA